MDPPALVGHPSLVHAVVIDRVSGDIAERAGAAAAVLGVTAYDVRPSMQVPGGGPAVLVVIGDRDHAEATRAGLQAAGFVARVVPVEGARTWFDVRDFLLGRDALQVQTRTGTALEVPYGSVRVLVRATPVTTTSTTKEVRKTKFAPMRSALSGGLVNTKTVKETKTQRTTDSDELVFVFAPGLTPLRMTQSMLHYQGLGPAMAPSQMANFTATVAALRQRCPGATYDERLRKRVVQSQMLGRTLDPSVYIGFAARLVANSVARTA